MMLQSSHVGGQGGAESWGRGLGATWHSRAAHKAGIQGEEDVRRHIAQHNLLQYKIIPDPNRAKMSTFAQGAVASSLQGKLPVEVNPGSGIS